MMLVGSADPLGACSPPAHPDAPGSTEKRVPMIKLILLRLLESYFRHRWLFLLPAVLLTAAGIAFALLVPADYKSAGSMMIEKESLLATLTDTAGANPWRTAASMTVDELNELLATDAFVRSAIAKTDLEASMAGDIDAQRAAFDEFRGSIVVRAVGEKLIEISGTNADAKLAQQIAASTMESYIQWQINKDYQESVVAQQFFANLITPYQQELQTARDNLQIYLETYPEPLRGERPPEERMEIDRLQSEIQRAEERVTETLRSEESARLALAKSESITRQTYLVIDTPTEPLDNFSLRDVAISVILFAVVGAFLSFSGIVVGALLDRTLRFPVDVHQALHLPLLATVATDKPRKKGQAKEAAGERAAQRTETPVKSGSVTRA